MQLTDFKVLSFDCYGTLIDWETGITLAVQSLLARTGKTLGRDQVLETFARHEAAQESETPSMIYSELCIRAWRKNGASSQAGKRTRHSGIPFAIGRHSRIPRKHCNILSSTTNSSVFPTWIGRALRRALSGLRLNSITYSPLRILVHTSPIRATSNI